MTLLRRRLAVNEPLVTVKYYEVINEMYVTRAYLNLYLSCLCNGLDGIKCLDLSVRQSREVRRARIGSATYKSSPAKVYNKLRVLVEENRTALESRTRYYIS